MEEEEKAITITGNKKEIEPLPLQNINDKKTNVSNNPQDNKDLVFEILGTDDSISEHLTSTSGSIENDRSLQEIEIFNQPGENQPDSFQNFLLSDKNISREIKPRSFLDVNSEESDSSTVAEKILSPKNKESQINAKSIMEEILSNDQFHSSHETDKSNEESFNLFANVNLDDKSLLDLSNNRENSPKSKENSFNSAVNRQENHTITREDSFNTEKNPFAPNFDLATEDTSISSKNAEFAGNIRQLEEILQVKEVTIKALKSEIDSLRENSNTFTSSVTSTTEYKQLQDECMNKLLEYDSAIIYKNDMIQELSESLKQSVEERNELLKQIELYRAEIVDLHEKVRETSQMVQEHQCRSPKKSSEIEEQGNSVEVGGKSLENIEKILEKTSGQGTENASIDVPNLCSKEVIQESIPNNDYILNLETELKHLKEKLKLDKEEYDSEIHRLRELISNLKCGSSELMELKTQLEVTHNKEMEDLRKYFEKKCVDLEKNYSEEIYSQQSRKLSGSSSDLEPSMDLLFSNQPGPGGDTNNILKTKQDLDKLQENLNNLFNKISKYASDEMHEQDLSLVEAEIRTELNSLLKIGEKLEIKAIKNNYLEEITNLKYQLEQCQKNHVTISNAIQEVASSGEFELEDIVQSYERRLQEQVNLARIDIISDLDVQFQKLLSDDCTKDEVWPDEFLKIKENFAKKYEKEIDILKQEHQDELSKLKEEHFKVLNSALERARRRSRDGDSLNESEMNVILKERNHFKREVQSLRNLISELVSYFVKCEDTLNNTLVDELLKQGSDKNLSQLEDDIINLDDSSGTNSSNKALDSPSSVSNVTRVHITPNFDDLISKIEDKSRLNDSQDISLELKNELGMCLKKLTQDANAILAITCNLPRNQIHKDLSPSNTTTPINTPEMNQNSQEKDKISLEKMKHEMDLKLKYKQELEDANYLVESLENEKAFLEKRTEEAMERITIMDVELQQAKFRIAELLERKELFTEGYGEQGGPLLIGLGDTMTMLATLQEKARTLLALSRASADPNVLQLVEELCRVSEKIKDEANRDRNDLVQQIEAADKKYKTTQKFLEEQAQERELERDEAQRRIKDLQEQLKERDRDRTNCQLMSDEAQHLESQLEEATFVLQAELKKFKELESERDEAVEKIKYLRDIIIELESQNDSKNKEIEEQIQTVDKLKCIIQEQHQVIDDLKNLDSFKSLSDNRELRQHIEVLEGELQKLRIGAELAGTEGATRQIKLQLFELETCLDKKTKDLEQFYQTTGTNSCSSPSEEMSVRDLVRPQTPTSIMEDCEVPLQQLARIKEKLTRHNRAEETALKRIRDMEMQVQTLKTELDENLNEKEFMKKEINEHIVLISELQIRLDKQRLRAEYIEKQTNTSLETKIHDLNTQIQNFQEKLRNKEKMLTQSEHLLEETRKQLKDAQNEISSPKNEEEMLISLQRELETLRSENERLKVKMSTDTQVLVDKIIQDKNLDIKKLKTQLEQTQNELQNYTSLNLDRHDLKTIANLKNTGTSIEQILSIIDLSQPIDKMRRYESHSGNFDSFEVLRGQKHNETEFLGSSSEISNIEKVGPSNLHYTITAPLGKPNSTEILKSAEKKVRFEEDTEDQNLLKQIKNLEDQIAEKQEIIQDLEHKLSLVNELEHKLKKQEDQLDNYEKSLASTTETFQKEQEAAKEKERLLGVELAEKKLHLSEREKEIEHLKADSKRKDDMCIKLSREKMDLKSNLAAFKNDSLSNLDTMISEKNIQNLELQKRLATTADSLAKAQLELHAKKGEIDLKKGEIKTLIDLVNTTKLQMRGLEDSLKMHVDKTQYEQQQNIIAYREIKCQKEKIEALETKIKTLQETIKLQEAKIIDKDCEVEILTEDMRLIANDLTEADTKVKELQEGKFAIDMTEKDKLKKEIEHLKDYLGEKDKIIAKMKEDYDVVNGNLHSINKKIKETGNILDLSSRLKAEQKKNAALSEEIHGLKAKLLNYDVANSAPVEAITDQLKKELNYSAQIDANILNAVSDQSLSSISEGHDVEVYKKALSRQKSLNKQLMRAKEQLEKQNLALEQAKQNFLQQADSLQSKIEKERMNFKQVQIEDGNLIEQLRLQIEALLQERENFERLVNDEKHCRRALEVQIEELKKPLSSTESSTKYKSLPNQDTLELMQLKTGLTKLQEGKLELSKRLNEVIQIKNQIENNLKYTKEMLLLEAERNRNAEEKIRVLIEKEKALNLDILQKKFEIENRVTELEEKKIVIDELQQEKSLLKKQKNDLINALKAQTTPSNPFTLQPLPETTEKLIKELKIKTEENRRQLEYVEKLESDVRKLEAQVRSESRNKTDNDVEFRHLVARCDYLFAKTLKLESVRKSLIWQKRYLSDFLQSHRKKCLIEALPERQQHDRLCIRRRHSPLTHFRSAVLAVVSLIRMQYLVKRWHNGIRKIEIINSRHYVKKASSSKEKERSPTGANFQVGQPVSNDHFAPAPLRLTSTCSSTATSNPFLPPGVAQLNQSRPVSPSLSTISFGSTVRDPSSLYNMREMSWSGQTPPCKESRRRERLRIGTNSLSKQDVTPLKAPQLLAQFQERFHQIQEKLTFPTDTDST